MGEMTLIEIVGNVGFPVAVSIYLLARFEKKIEKLEDAIRTLNKSVSTKHD